MTPMAIAVFTQTSSQNVIDVEEMCNVCFQSLLQKRIAQSAQKENRPFSYSHKSLNCNIAHVKVKLLNVTFLNINKIPIIQIKKILKLSYEPTQARLMKCCFIKG